MAHMDDLWEQIQLAIDDAKADYPDVPEGDLVHSIVDSMTLGYSLSVRREMMRRAGFYPDW